MGVIPQFPRCWVCDRAFPSEVAFAAHLVKHPGRTDDELAWANGLVLSTGYTDDDTEDYDPGDEDGEDPDEGFALPA